MKRAMIESRAALCTMAVLLVSTGPVRAAPDCCESAQSTEAALQDTARTGQPMLLVVTSSTQPEANEFWAELGTRASAGLPTGRIARVFSEDCLEFVHRLGIKQMPTVLRIEKGEHGLAVTSRLDGPRTVDEVLTWARERARPSAPGARIDSQVKRTRYDADTVAPSPQGPSKQQPAPAPPTAAPAPPKAAPPVAYIPAAAPVAPTVPLAVTAPASATIVPVPSPTVVVQPTAPTVLIAPAPAPTVLAAVPVAAPVAPAASVPNLFLNTPTTVPAVAPIAPAVAPTIPIVAVSPVTAYSVASVAAVQPVAAMQSVAAVQPIVALPPSRLGRWVGAVGDYLARFKYPRVAGASTTTVLAQPAVAPMVPAVTPMAVSVPVAMPAPVFAPALVPVSAPTPISASTPPPPPYIAPTAPPQPSSQR